MKSKKRLTETLISVDVFLVLRVLVDVVIVVLLHLLDLPFDDQLEGVVDEYVLLLQTPSMLFLNNVLIPGGKLGEVSFPGQDLQQPGEPRCSVLLV